MHENFFQIVILITIIFITIYKRNMDFIFYSIVFFLIFQQSFTFQVGATIRLTDILIIVYFFFYLINKRKCNVNIPWNIYPLIYYLYIFMSYLILLYINKEIIFLGNSTLKENNLNKIYINLLNPLISILYFILPYTHIYKFNSLRLKKVLTIQKKALNFLSIYTIIQFLILNITGQFIKLPGEKLNYGTSFAYGLRRPWGFMIEPGGLALFLMFNLIVVFLIDDEFKLNLINVVALIVTFSTNGLICLFVFMILLLNKRKALSVKQKMLYSVVFVVFIFMIFNNEYLYRALIEKLTTDNFSKVDRLNNKEILLKIFNDYKFFGIGHGNFGFYRNLYGIDTKIPYKDFFDLSNNFYFGVLADTGIIGVIILLIYFKDIYNKSKIINKHKSKVFIVILMIMIIPSSTILFSYFSFYLGIIYAYSMNLYICINKKIR